MAGCGSLWTAQAGFRVGTASRLFNATSTFQTCEPSADGERFLTSVQRQDTVSPPLTVVVNWTADLPKR